MDRNPYKLLFDIKEAIKVQQIRHEYGYGYIRLAARGNFPLFDYECGLLWIKVTVLSHLPAENKLGGYIVLFTVGCADDGLWQAWSKYMSQEDAIKLADRIAKEAMPDLNPLPTEKAVNECLTKYGMYGVLV